MAKMQIGRLAFRVEGDMWNAYWADVDTMGGAVMLGSIRLTSEVRENPERKQAFMDLMRDTFADTVEVVTGTRPDFDEPHRAPEHERAGRG